MNKLQIVVAIASAGFLMSCDKINTGVTAIHDSKAIQKLQEYNEREKVNPYACTTLDKNGLTKSEYCSF